MNINPSLISKRRISFVGSSFVSQDIEDLLNTNNVVEVLDVCISEIKVFALVLIDATKRKKWYCRDITSTTFGYKKNMLPFFITYHTISIQGGTNTSASGSMKSYAYVISYE
jgi:hypothetical protein